MRSIVCVGLLVGLLSLTIGTRAHHHCGDPALDPEPYPMLSDEMMSTILRSTDLNLGSSTGTRVTIVSYANGVATISPGMPDYTDLADVQISNYLRAWGFNVETHDWTDTSVSFTFLPGPPPPVPLSRLYLLDLGESVIPGRKVQMTRYSAPESWDTTSIDSPRTALIRIDYAPRDELGLENLLVKWFCERNVTVDIQYGGLETANPVILVKEILPAVDECVTGQNACEHTCVDGQDPNPGYTCQDPSGTRFAVTEVAIGFYSLAETLFPQVNITTTGFRMIQHAPHPSQDATYTIGIDKNLDGKTIDDILPGFRDMFSVLVQPLHPSRIDMNFVGNSFRLHFNSPEYRTVRWTGPYENSTGFPALKQAIYKILNLNPDDVKNHDLFDPEYDQPKRELTIYFREDMTVAEDHSYINRSCTFAQSLFNKDNKAAIESIGFKIEGVWRMPETNPDTCPLIDPNDSLAPLRRNDGTLNMTLIGIIIGVIALVIVIVIIVVLVIVGKKKGWKMAPTVV